MSDEVLVVYKKNFEDVHDKALSTVRSALDELMGERDINVGYTARETVRRADFAGPELVIVLGGDGTLTSIAHSVDDSTPVMGVNSHPRSEGSEGSYGFYMGSDPSNFAADVRIALDGGAIVNVLPRLQAEIVTTSGNRTRCDPALNDLLVANTHQYQPSKYRLQRGDIDTVQHSSGCLFSTFLGQGAWFRHVADIEGATFPAEQINDHYLFVARELPRRARVDDGSYWEWVSESTVISSDMHRGYVVSDGWDETHFTRGATLSVGLNGPTLRLLTFRGSILDRVAQWMDG
ncbi:MAG: NAD(+)/NADH kinase [Candidatus Thermoplasmatota archaeon]|nr:NAD(+)/NADH kinase [Candidatus Thermoplasmatota archaeon]